MKPILTVLLLILAFQVKAQECYEPLNNGLISLHYTYRNGGNGIGMELGQIGRLSEASFMLGGSVVKYPRYKTATDSSEVILYAKILYRIWHPDYAYVSLMTGLTCYGPEFDEMLGVRGMLITGQRTAVAIEPFYYLNQRTFQYNLHLMFIF